MLLLIDWSKDGIRESSRSDHPIAIIFVIVETNRGGLVP